VQARRARARARQTQQSLPHQQKHLHSDSDGSGGENGGMVGNIQRILDQIRLLIPRAQRDGDKRAQTQLELLQSELDGFIAADCPLCGYAMIENIAVPLVNIDDTSDADEDASWTI
jgi:hypothetical protein